jgi:hypothetical protein
LKLAASYPHHVASPHPNSLRNAFRYVLRIQSPHRLEHDRLIGIRNPNGEKRRLITDMSRPTFVITNLIARNDEVNVERREETTRIRVGKLPASTAQGFT